MSRFRGAAEKRRVAIQSTGLVGALALSCSLDAGAFLAGQDANVDEDFRTDPLPRGWVLGGSAFFG